MKKPKNMKQNDRGKNYMNMPTNKLNNCVCMGSSSYMLPALANMIIGIEKHSPNTVDQYVILHDKNEVFENNDLLALNKITDKIRFYPIDFDEKYKLPTLKILSGSQAYNRIIFAKYFVFELLKDYRHVLWLDTDMVVVQDLSDLFKMEGAAWRPVKLNLAPRCNYIANYVKNNYSKVNVTDPIFPPPSGGLVYVSDTLNNYANLTEKCFQILSNAYVSAEKVTNALDELVFGIINYTDDLKAHSVETKFNCVPGSKSDSQAVIIHCFGKYKFWNTPSRYNRYPEWGENNNKWLSFGGRNLIQNMVVNKFNKVPTVGIMNFHFANNFGAVLVPFAMLKVIKDLGYDTEIINYIPKEIPPRNNFIEFRKTFLNITEKNKEMKTRKELIAYQKKYNKIVVGSDQVWRLFNTSLYMLDFAHGEKTLISYAASFGGNDFTKLTNEKAISLLNRFDAISVREESGVDICNNQFGMPAIQVLDPTLLLDISDYEQIIEHFNPLKLNEDYIAYSIINKANVEDFSTNQENLGERLRLKFKNLILTLNSKEINSVGGWLSDIKNAKFVITDSFHATVFSIIYRKKFACLVTDANGKDRIPSLLKLLGIDPSERIVKSLADITPELLSREIDYDSVSQKLNVLKEKSILFLRNALMKPENHKELLVK